MSDVSANDRNFRVYELLEKVCDQPSFIAFVRELADEREAAAEIERAYPERYMVDGAHDWKNADIESFLYAALDYFEDKPFHKPEAAPSWRMFAEFLWCGKIIE
jgi:hypothetical protein